VASSNNPIEDGNYILGNIWIQVSLIALCFLLSSYLTGLNIGLLSFDKYGLLLMIHNGTKDEQRYARVILPYLHEKHQALITILMIKTFCESVFTLLLDNLFIQIAPPAISLVITAISLALILLILGEIIPQSIFFKYSLQISALTHGFIDTLWLLTWLISYPLSRILDAIIGDDQPKSSNQIFMLQEILDRVLINGDRIHIQIILRALAIDDVITSFINLNVQEVYDGNGGEGIEDCGTDVAAAMDCRQGISLKIYYSSSYSCT
ncbi:MAG: Metal transporter cnnm2, partial [Marteilia pararefringens]